MRPSIAYYITPHGFGHAVRSLEVIRQLLHRAPELEVILVSDIPEVLVEQNVGGPLPYRRKRLDIGLVQKDSVQFDLEASRNALQALFDDRSALVAEEVRFLKERHIQAIVSDIAFLPFHAARRCGVPALGLSNFTWDWIYGTYARTDPRWEPLIDWIQTGYRSCDLFLQLPMHGDCSVMRHIRDVPLVARKARRTREETRAVLGCRPEQKAYLIAFATLDLDEAAQRRLEKLSGAVFYYKWPLRFEFANGISLDGYDLSYADVVAAMDGIITKPGYGIVSDCLVHARPMIYTDRGLFPEYEILVDEMNRHLPTVHMPSRDLYAGAWEAAIQKLEHLPPRTPRIRHDGASICAEIIAAHVSGAEPRTGSLP